MNQNPSSHESLKDQARNIGRQGQELRKRIEQLVSGCSDQLKNGSHRLTDIAKDVIEGAQAGIAETAPPGDEHSRLRQVIDGLGDGLTKAANATRLAFEEASSRGRHFAQNDVRQLSDDLKSLRDLFVEIVSRTTANAGSSIKNEASDTASHIKRTFESLKPSLDQALQAAKDDPSQLAKESSQALVSVSRQAAGALFSAMSDLMRDAADKLNKTTASANASSTTNTPGDSSAAAADQGPADATGNAS